MKAIKCPNCGKRMTSQCGLNLYTANGQRASFACDACGVCGPTADAPTERGAVQLAARLTREWIARMEREKEYVAELEISATRYQCAQELLKLIRSTPAGPLAALIKKWEGKK